MGLRQISRTAEEQNALIKRFGIAQDPAEDKPEEGDTGTIEQKLQTQRDLREAIYKVALIVDTGIEPSREASLALTKLEEALMWAGKAIFS